MKIKRLRTDQLYSKGTPIRSMRVVDGKSVGHTVLGKQYGHGCQISLTRICGMMSPEFVFWCFRSPQTAISHFARRRY